MRQKWCCLPLSQLNPVTRVVMSWHTRCLTDAKGNCSAALFQDFSRRLAAVEVSEMVVGH
jgi:hypothetical protein